MMFSTEPMQKVRMIFLDRERDKIVAFLHGQGVVDFRRSKLELGEVQSANSVEISNALIRVNGALAHLKPSRIDPISHIMLSGLLERVKNASYIDQIYLLGDQQRAILEDRANLDYAQRIANYFAGVEIDFSTLQSSALSFKAYVSDHEGANKIRLELEKAKIKSSVAIQKHKKNQAVIFVAYDKKASVEEALKGTKVDEIDLKSKYLTSTPAQVLLNVEKIKEDHAKSLKQIDERLGVLGTKHYSELSNFKEMLEIESQRASAHSNFKKTDKAFVVEGWIAAKKYEELVLNLKKFTSNRFEIERIADKELAPTLVNRPSFLKPFDFLMEFYSVPRSDEIDPTWIFIVTFPIFYGLMISDVGYGIASFLFAQFVIGKTKPDDLLHNVAKVWRLCAISAVFFGFLSDNYLGFQLNHNFTTFVGFDWIKNVTSILLFTIIFGLAQVILGFFFGFVNNWKHGHKKHAISKLASIVSTLLGVVAIYGFFTAASFTGTFGILTAIAVIFTAAISGTEASEITNLMTHPLSYARVLGFGMASVIVALLINTSFTPNFSGGILGFIILLVVFLLLHTINMFLGMFEGLIQGVRLNFVEFFSKFYTGGGIKFRPFSYKRTNTKE